MTQNNVVPFYSHECPDCTFALDRTQMTVTEEQLALATVTIRGVISRLFHRSHPEDLIVPIGRYTMPQWNGHNMFWLFQCPACSQHSVDYLHGYQLYLSCQHCDASTSVHQDRFYKESGLPPLPTFRERVRMYRELRARYRT